VERVSIVDGTPQLQLDGRTIAEADPAPGRIERGTYDYKVVFEGLGADGEQVLFAVDIGPLETTGTPGKDQSILLSNLPLTDGRKAIYRTDASGTGDYHLIAQVNGSVPTYLDNTGNADLTGPALTALTTRHDGGRRYTVSLDNVAEIRLHEDRSGTVE
jgi:hypothetical protein